MLIREFNSLLLKGAELIKITLRNGNVVNGILLDDEVKTGKILIYNLKKKKEMMEEYIKIDIIEQLEIIS